MCIWSVVVGSRALHMPLQCAASRRCWSLHSLHLTTHIQQTIRHPQMMHESV